MKNFEKTENQNDIFEKKQEGIKITGGNRKFFGLYDGKRPGEIKKQNKK